MTRRTTMSAPAAWSRLTDWGRHGEFIPLTAVTRQPNSPLGLGAVFVAHTSVGLLQFDDPMEVTFWRPPTPDEAGSCRIVKRGRVVTGWAVLTVASRHDGACITWLEDARVKIAGPLLDLPTMIAGKRVFARLVDGLLLDADSG
ncbi:MAG: SRPBCC family protein [Nocardioidaceae bacterium]